MCALSADWVKAGRIGSAHGIKGMCWVYSLTEPRDNVFSYTPWQLVLATEVLDVRIESWRTQGKGLVVKLQEFSDRSAIESWVGAEIFIQRQILQQAREPGSYLWSELLDARVVTVDGVDLGVVFAWMETGANDVLVVHGDSLSVDRRERLVPWLLPEVIKDVDVSGQRLMVDWDPEF